MAVSGMQRIRQLGHPKLRGAVAAAHFVNRALEPACPVILQEAPLSRCQAAVCDLPSTPLARQAGALGSAAERLLQLGLRLLLGLREA